MNECLDMDGWINGELQINGWIVRYGWINGDLQINGWMMYRYGWME